MGVHQHEPIPIGEYMPAKTWTRQVTFGAFTLGLLTTFYIAFLPTRHFTFDAVNRLVFIEADNTYEVWHSQHLLAQWPGQAVYQLFGGEIRAWEATHLIYAIFAGLTAILVH